MSTNQGTDSKPEPDFRVAAEAVLSAYAKEQADVSDALDDALSLLFEAYQGAVAAPEPPAPDWLPGMRRAADRAPQAAIGAPAELVLMNEEWRERRAMGTETPAEPLRQRLLQLLHKQPVRDQANASWDDENMIDFALAALANERRG